jgi:biopolymer transport protein ExbB/TolQ
MNAIAEANDISPAIVAMGYGMSLTSILFGLFIFIVSMSIWFFFRWRFKKIIREGN